VADPFSAIIPSNNIVSGVGVYPVRKEAEKKSVIRQYLVLAEQVKQVLQDTPRRSMRDIAKWLGYPPARLSQIFKLTFLASSIKEEILLSDEQYIHSITVTAVCKIAYESSLERQMEVWRNIKSPDLRR